MSRWIDKLITRHLEPEHTVRPLPAGVFHAAAEQEMSFPEENVSKTGEVRSMDNEARVLSGGKRGLEGDKKIFPEKVMMDEKKVFPDREKVVKDEKKALTGGGVVPEDKAILEDKEEEVPGHEERIFKGEEEVMKKEKKERLADAAGVKDLPVMQGKVQTKVETRVRYVTRETPVLQDLSEGERVTESASGEEKTMPGVSEEGKIGTRVPEVMRGMQAQQTIHVSIGRIEIKAVTSPVETKVTPVKKGGAVMGLDQYLEQRNPAKR